jgi:hypothetical protein
MMNKLSRQNEIFTTLQTKMIFLKLEQAGSYDWPGKERVEERVGPRIMTFLPGPVCGLGAGKPHIERLIGHRQTPVGKIEKWLYCRN